MIENPFFPGWLNFIVDDHFFSWEDEGLVTGGQMIVGWEVHLGQFHGRPLILQISTNLASPHPTLASGNEKVFDIHYHKFLDNFLLSRRVMRISLKLTL